MLDFLKEILGDAWTDEIDARAEAEIAKLYAPRADLDAALADKDTAKKAAQQAADDLAAARYDAMLETAILKRGGIDNVAIKAHLNHDDLRGSEDPQKAIDAALDAQIKERGYLYKQTETPPPLAPAAGSASLLTGGDEDGVTTAFYALNPDLKP